MRAWLLLLAVAVCGHAATVLEWAASPSPEVSGYKVYAGMASRSYGQVYDVGTNRSVPITAATGTWFFAVTAYTTNSFESDFSPEVFTTFVPAPTSLRIVRSMTVQGSTNLTDWVDLITLFPTNQTQLIRVN